VGNDHNSNSQSLIITLTTVKKWEKGGEAAKGAGEKKEQMRGAATSRTAFCRQGERGNALKKNLQNAGSGHKGNRLLSPAEGNFERKTSVLGSLQLYYN